MKRLSKRTIIIFIFLVIIVITIVIYKKKISNNETLTDEEADDSLEDSNTSNYSSNSGSNSNSGSSLKTKIKELVSNSNVKEFFTGKDIEGEFFPYYKTSKDTNATNKFPIKKGSKNNAVKQLQYWLTNICNIKTSVDGQWGSGTENSVKQEINALSTSIKNYNSKYSQKLSTDFSKFITYKNGAYSISLEQYKQWETLVEGIYKRAQQSQNNTFQNFNSYILDKLKK